MKRNIFYLLMALVMVFSNASGVFAQQEPPDRFDGRDLPASVEALKLDSPLEMDGLFGMFSKVPCWALWVQPK